MAHRKGDLRLPSRRIVLPDDVDVKRIRRKAGMSQAEFAHAFCINPRTLQEWEEGRRKPDATTRAYLAVIAKNRKAVLNALAWTKIRRITRKTTSRRSARTATAKCARWRNDDQSDVGASLCAARTLVRLPSARGRSLLQRARNSSWPRPYTPLWLSSRRQRGFGPARWAARQI